MIEIFDLFLKKFSYRYSFLGNKNTQFLQQFIHLLSNFLYFLLFITLFPVSLQIYFILSNLLFLNFILCLCDSRKQQSLQFEVEKVFGMVAVGREGEEDAMDIADASFFVIGIYAVRAAKMLHFW